METDRLFPATGMPDQDWWQALWPDPEDTLRKMGVTEAMTVIDLCCGDGHFTAPLAGIAAGKLYGVDLDPDMLEKTRDALSRQGAQARALICADARDLAQVVPEPVDYIFVANTFHGVPDKRGFAESVAGALKPGGKLGIVNWHPLDRETTQVLGKPRGPKTALRMAPETVRQIVQPAGLKAMLELDLPPFHYGIVFETAS